MGVLIEGFNVLIRNATVEERLPGGMREYQESCPNGTFCTDGEICRVGFMTSRDAHEYLVELKQQGFVMPDRGGSPDVAIIDEVEGLRFPCDWLELRRVSLGKHGSAQVAWTLGTPLTKLVAPPGWKPGQTVMRRLEDVRERCEFLGTTDGVDVYRDRETGETFYVGRTSPQFPADSTRSLPDRFRDLWQELERLGAIEGVPATEYEGDLWAVHARAEQMVKETEGLEVGPLMLQGIASRCLGRWEEAALLFEQVTELKPELIDGWLELTRSWAHSGRLEDAEKAARKAVELKPEDVRALGNLAGALCQLERFEEARPPLERALEIDPTDQINQNLMARLAALRAPRNQSWWKTLLRG
jgi:tetratricopeptide repeat protein